MEINLNQESLPLFNALASSTRLKIIEFIGSQTKSIKEVADQLGLSEAITSRHIAQLVEASLLKIERGNAGNRHKKWVALKTDHIQISFPQKIYHEYKLHSIDLKVGHFNRFNIEPTCGLASKTAVIGRMDDPRFFFDSGRMEANLLWFANGFVEYTVPNLLSPTQRPMLLEVSFEISSEFPISNNTWKSDVSIFLNDIKVATYTCPGNYSDVRGKYTPSWWSSDLSQYGLLKHLRVNTFDTGIDGEFYSPVTLNYLHLQNSPFIKLRFEIEKDAVHKGGLTLFGEGFGNHNQNIKINTYYVEGEGQAS